MLFFAKMLLIWAHKLIYIVLIILALCKHACKVDYDAKSRVDPLPFWLGCEQKMLGFSQVWKPIKWQDLLEERKNGFQTCAKIHFSENNILGLGDI